MFVMKEFWSGKEPIPYTPEAEKVRLKPWFVLRPGSKTVPCAGMKRFIEESNIFSHSDTAAVGLGAEKTVDQSADSRKRLRPAKSAHFQFQVWWEAVRGWEKFRWKSRRVVYVLQTWPLSSTVVISLENWQQFSLLAEARKIPPLHQLFVFFFFARLFSSCAVVAAFICKTIDAMLNSLTAFL